MASNEPMRIDSRKFLGALNDSAQAKITFFEDRVKQMGKSAGKNWRLAALHAKNLYIEDIDTNSYYIANHQRSNGKVAISNIRALEIIEEEKKGLFGDTCHKLVDAISENDQRGMQAAFDRMKAQRFSGRAVPFSGAVKCRDGVLRKVNIRQSGVTLEDNTKGKLVAAIVESLRDNVIVENGEIVAGLFDDGQPVNLPVTKWASRKLVARRMLEAAQNAYWSDGFQTRIANVAGHIAEGRIGDAVKYISPFLEEMEEFTLLNRAQVQTLVENALAAKAIFNQQLCNDTATLMFRTNMKLSRGKIVAEWKNIANKSENSVLAENVRTLERSNNFESTYQKFLSMIFETISNREVAAEALATTLDVLRNKTPKIKESHELSSKLNSLITRLKDRNIDDAAIYEAEDLIATIQEELAAADTLQGFDQMPQAGGPTGGEMADFADTMGGPAGAAPVGAGAGSGAPVININSPLIQIGGSSGTGTQGEDLGMDMDLGMDEPMPEEGGEEDLDALLGADAGAAPAAPPAGGAPAVPAAPAAGGVPAAPAAGGMPALESRRSRKALSESRPVHYEMRDDEDDDMPCDDEGDLAEGFDPYALSKSERYTVGESIYVTEYGTPVITDEEDLYKIFRIMQRLATENKLVGNSLERNLPSMAKASIKAIGLHIPEGKMNMALEQVVTYFMEEDEKKPFPGAKAPFKKHGKSGHKPWEKKEKSGIDADGDGIPNWEDDDEGVAEDQYMSPRIPQRGLKKRSVGHMSCESIRWGRSQEDAILGEMNGVRFVFDHGGQSSMQPVILSEDGSVEIPIPEYLHESAYVAADLIDVDHSAVDPNEFAGWLAESLEQLRAISDDEDAALNEAMAKITTGPNGEINVEVTDDVNVDEVGGDDMDMMGMDDEIGGEMDDADEKIDGFDMDDEEEGMKPVDSLDVGEPSDVDESDDEMPDFEGSMTKVDEVDEDMEKGEEESEDEDEEDEEGMAEDNDIADPKSAKYTKHVKDNKREFPAHKMPKASDDSLEDIGPDVKEDDGSGTNPPTAKKGR